LYSVPVLFIIAEIREVQYSGRSGIYWLGSYPFPLAKRDVSLLLLDCDFFLTRKLSWAVL